ncbi:NAD(P)-dependent alcohol dehydrogenase [Chloroflexota bacterium]
MKAMVYHDYGSLDNLELQEVEMPAVKDDEVLVKTHAASVNWHDWHFLMGTPFMARMMAGGLFKPKNSVLGSDMAGRVEAVGASVKQLRPGDEVFGSTRHGCFAEYVCVSEEELVTKPASITFESAAAAGAAAFTALQGLRDAGQIKPGQQVLINGASGGVGTFAVQIAKAFGANVTGVCSTRNLDMVLSIGADQVVDYTQEQVTQSEKRYDLIFDVVAKLLFSECEPALGPKGIYATTAFSPGLALRGLWSSVTGGKRMVPLMGKRPSVKDHVLMKEFLEAGKVKAVIDREYSLAQVPQALRYLEGGHTRGKIVIRM